MADYNVQMKNFNEDTSDYDYLFPKSKTKLIDDADGINLDDNLALVRDQPYYDVAYQEYEDDITGSRYVITTLPKTDENGDIIPLKHEFANDSMNSGDGETARSFANRKNASFVANGSRWAGSTSLIDGIQIKDGVILQTTPYIDNYTLGIKADNTLKAYPSTVSAQTILDDGCVQALSGFYPLIENSVAVNPTIYQASGEGDTLAPRQVIAQMPDNTIIFMSVDGRTPDSPGMSFADVIRVLTAYGVSFAYNLDGGGSTQTLVRGVLTTTPSDDDGMTERLVKDFLYLDKPDSKRIKLKSVNHDLGYITKKITELKAMINNFNAVYGGFFEINAPAGYNAQGIEILSDGTPLTKLYTREGDISYYNYEMDDYTFRAHKTGELQTVKGQVADFYSTSPQVSDLNSLDDSGYYWGNATATSNVPNTGCSWSVQHIKYDSDNKLQIATPFSEDTQYVTMIRRTGSGGTWQSWRNA